MTSPVVVEDEVTVMPPVPVWLPMLFPVVTLAPVCG